jgi:hypothetical protein
MSDAAVNSKLPLVYLVASPKFPSRGEEAASLNDIRKFWHAHWDRAFAQTGAPESGWESHFEQQDIVVALKLNSEIISCHLYTFYDLHDARTLESDYFSYFKKSSIDALKAGGVTKLMSMEYLGVSSAHSRNSEKLSLGKLMVTLATYVGSGAGADAVFGTPITTTSTPKMMANVGAVTLEENIEKYGYNLCLQYVPTNPRRPSADPVIEARAFDLWHARDVINRIGRFEPQKRAA